MKSKLLVILMLGMLLFSCDVTGGSQDYDNGTIDTTDGTTDTTDTTDGTTDTTDGTTDGTTDTTDTTDGTTDTTDGTTDTTDSTTDTTDNTTRYVLDGINVLLVHDIESAESRSILSDDEIVAVGEIPGVGTVVETESGKYYLEGSTDFNEITLPAGTLKLHINQFTINSGYVYYGIDNKLYRETTNSFDSTFNGEVVVDGQIFSDSGNLVTSMQYIIDGVNIIYLTRGIQAGTYMESASLQWNSKGTAGTGDDTYTCSKTIDSLHSAYISISSDGTMNRLFDGAVIDYTNVSGTVLTLHNNFVGPKFFGQSQEMNGYRVNGRLDSENESAYTGTYGLVRDTMFTTYRDSQVYNWTDLDRKYLVLNDDSINISVEVYATVNNKVEKIGNGFTVEFEAVGSKTKLIPNMWVDTDNSVWISRGTEVKNFDASGNLNTILTFSNRIDSFTVLPSGDVIVMDMYGDWFNEDGSSYTGLNIVAKY